VRRRLPLAVWGITIVLGALQVALVIAARSVKAPPAFGIPGFNLILSLAFASVGALVASRQPSNPIGWIFVGVGFVFSVQGVAYEYAVNGILGSGAPWPGAVIGAWLNAWIWFPSVMAVATFVFLLFPHGALPSRRWRPVAYIAGAGLVLGSMQAFRPGPLENFSSVVNPFAVPTLTPLGNVGFLVSNVLIIACASSLVVRYRRARTTEREQIKWLAYAGAIAAITLPFGDFFGSRWRVADVLILLSIVFIPIAIGIAVLRYRLYDIDRIISRTVSYALVTGLMAATFALVVLAIPALVGAQQKTPSWVIAVATLFVAVLFQPVRRRVQSSVDHRFNRARYDASHTIEAFSTRLREEIDIDALSQELQDIVRRTMQPDTVGIWLRP
jgi:hypothetical protein